MEAGIGNPKQSHHGLLRRGLLATHTDSRIPTGVTDVDCLIHGVKYREIVNIIITNKKAHKPALEFLPNKVTTLMLLKENPLSIVIQRNT